MDQEPQPNRRLRLQRRLRGWSQEDVAMGLHKLAASQGEPELGVDATMISRWERGTRRPRPRYVRLMCQLFELPAEQLGMVGASDLRLLPKHTLDPLEEDDVQRRDFINRVGKLLGVAALPMPRLQATGQEPWERLSRALRHPGSVDEQAVSHLEQMTEALESLGPGAVSARALFGPVTGHLDAITLLLQGSLPAPLRKRLCSLAGETAGFAGWLRWNMDDPAGAAAYFRTGLEAAREAGDDALAMYLVGSGACNPPYREDPGARVRALANEADASPATRVWLATKEADAHALLGDADSCLRALDRAEALLDRVSVEREGERPRFMNVDATWLMGERGASLAKLGQTGPARDLLGQVLGELGPTSERDRLWLLTSLASTYLQDSEPEEASRVAGIAYERASRMHLEPIVQMVGQLRQDLARFEPCSAVSELDERIRSTSNIA